MTTGQDTRDSYEAKAIEFCEKYEVNVYAQLVGHRKHFPEDKEGRDVYFVVLRRKGQVFGFEFGQSVKDSFCAIDACNRSHAIEIFSRRYYASKIEAKKRLNAGRSWFSPYRFTGVPLSAYTILSCLEKGGPMTFEEFCDLYGYSNDSIKHKAIWEKWIVEAMEVQRMFGDCMDDLQEIN